jgi:3-hydroxymyristoyl/3-hydroxydecanoyl-(acyl carrier protein) dehydratase
MKFRMVDRILAYEPHRAIRGIKTVSFEEYQLRERLGDEPCLPESLMIEALFQLCNWLIALSTDFTQMGVGVQWDEIRFLQRLRPGQRLHMEIVIRSWREDGVLVDGTASDGRQTIATGRRCMAALVPLADYHDPDDLRVLFSEIYCGEDPELREVGPCPA